MLTNTVNWWLRNPNNASQFRNVNNNGNMNNNNATNNNWLRPALQKLKGIASKAYKGVLPSINNTNAVL